MVRSTCFFLYNAEFDDLALYGYFDNDVTTTSGVFTAALKQLLVTDQKYIKVLIGIVN